MYFRPLDPRMTGDVGQALLDDPVGGSLDFERSAPGEALSAEKDVDTGAAAEALEQRLQGRCQPEAIQQRRPQIQRQPAHLGNGLVERLAGLVQALIAQPSGQTPG